MAMTNSSAVARTAVVMLLTCVAIMAATGFSIFESSEAVMTAEMNEVNDTDLAVLTELYEQDGLKGLSEAVNLTTNAPTGVHQIIGLFTLEGDYIIGDLDVLPDIKSAGEIRLRKGPDNIETAFLAKKILLPDAVLIVGRPSAIIQKTLRNLLFILPIASLALLATLMIGGGFASKTLGRYLDRFEGALKLFSRGDDTARVPLGPDMDDRLYDVSVGINHNLDYIANSTTNLRNTSTAIAHDLRTPLTRASLAIQVAESEGSLSNDAAEKLAQASLELGKLSATFDTILRISNISNSQSEAAFSQFDLHLLLAEIAESYDAVLEDVGYRLAPLATIDGPTMIWADRAMIAQLVINLLTNVMGHCPIGTTASMIVDNAAGNVTLTVFDDGPGVPPNELDTIFAPFSRLDQSRTAEGAGLGLALVRAITTHHDAELIAENRNPGLAVTVHFTLTKDGAAAR